MVACWADTAGEVLAEVTGAPVRDYSTRDFGRDRYPDARSVIIDGPDDAGMLDAVRARLPDGLLAFLGTSRWLGDEHPDGIELVVAPGSGGLDALAVAGTTANDLGLDTAALIRRLAPLDERYRVDIVSAETDRLSFRLERPPDDPDGSGDVVDVIAALAPDLPADEDTRAELARTASAGETIELWWD